MNHLLSARGRALLVDPARLEPVLGRYKSKRDFAVDNVADASVGSTSVLSPSTMQAIIARAFRRQSGGHA